MSQRKKPLTRTDAPREFSLHKTKSSVHIFTFVKKRKTDLFSFLRFRNSTESSVLQKQESKKKMWIVLYLFIFHMNCVRYTRFIFYSFFVFEFGPRSKKELFFKKSYFFGAGSKLKNEKRFFFFVFDAH